LAGLEHIVIAVGLNSVKLVARGARAVLARAGRDVHSFTGVPPPEESEKGACFRIDQINFVPAEQNGRNELRGRGLSAVVEVGARLVAALSALIELKPGVQNTVAAELGARVPSRVAGDSTLEAFIQGRVSERHTGAIDAEIPIGTSGEETVATHVEGSRKGAALGLTTVQIRISRIPADSTSIEDIGAVDVASAIDAGVSVGVKRSRAHSAAIVCFIRRASRIN